MSVLESNKRIAKNTVFLYARMILVMLVTLFTSRIVLAELGIVDFGIYNVVAGVVSMLGFLVGAMSLSVQRFLSFEMGRKNMDLLNTVFNVSLYAHLFLAIIVVIIAETLGLWFVKTQLVIPIERLDAALIIYQCVIVSSVLSVIGVPFNAVLLASEYFNIYAIASVIEVVLKLIIAYLLIIVTFDKLEFYGIISTIVTLLMTSYYIIYVRRKFIYTRIRWIWNKDILKKILDFSIWSLLGELAWTFVLQGINILINIFCGPTINAARAISYQVNTATCSLTRSFQQALNPQIIKQYAAGNMEEMKNLLFRGTRFSYYLMIFFIFPLLLETDIVLHFWLKEVPQHTVLFCKLVLIGSLVDGLSNLLATVAKAYGKIRNYQIVISLLLMLNFPLSYILLKNGFFPEITLIVYIGVSFCLLVARLIIIKQMVYLKPSQFFYNAIFPILKVTVIVSIILYGIHSLMEPSILRFLISCLSSIIVITIISLFIGMTRDERKYIFTTIQSKVKR